MKSLMPLFDTISIALRKAVSTRPLSGAMILPSLAFLTATSRPIVPFTKEGSPQSFSDMNCPFVTGAFNTIFIAMKILHYLKRFLISCLMICLPTSRTGFDVASCAVFFAPRLLNAAFTIAPTILPTSDISNTPLLKM